MFSRFFHVIAEMGLNIRDLLGKTAVRETAVREPEESGRSVRLDESLIPVEERRGKKE